MENENNVRINVWLLEIFFGMELDSRWRNGKNTEIILDLLEMVRKTVIILLLYLNSLVL